MEAQYPVIKVFRSPYQTEEKYYILVFENLYKSDFLNKDGQLCHDFNERNMNSGCLFSSAREAISCIKKYYKNLRYMPLELIQQHERAAAVNTKYLYHNVARKTHQRLS